MFAKFKEHNLISRINKEYYIQYDGVFENIISNNASLKNLFDCFGGFTFNQGLFRFHTLGSSYKWTEIVTNYFTNYKNKVCCFAFDWLGREFAISENGKYIFMFDPATGEANKLEASIEVFLNEDLVDYKDETFNVELFYNVIKKHNGTLDIDKCFGFKIPLFLGGEDTFQNYEIIDMDLYWEINNQIFNQINMKS